MRRTALLALVAALALPGAAGAAKNDSGAKAKAAEACQAERTADPAAFQAKYANRRGKRAFKRCVRAHVRSAKRGCRAERAQDRAAFRAKYGDSNGRHALRRCVVQHAGDPVA